MENYNGIYIGNIGYFNPKYPYTLNVKLPWGNSVFGSAMMPSQLHISWPKRGDTISIKKN